MSSRSAQIVVLPDPASPPSKLLAQRIATVLKNLNTGYTKLEYLCLALDGLKDSQLNQLKRSIRSIDDLVVTSLRLCDKSWAVMQKHLRLDGLRHLHVPNSRCLEQLRAPIGSLDLLKLDHGPYLEDDLDRVRQLFPRLQRLILGEEAQDPESGRLFLAPDLKELIPEMITVSRHTPSRAWTRNTNSDLILERGQI